MWNPFVVALIVCIYGSAFGQYDVRMPPSITKNPPPIIIYRSDRPVTIDCAAKGIPVVTYDWKKNGVDISQNHRNIRRGADGTITIESAASIDEGFYQCVARNQFGTALSTVAHLRRAFIGSSPGTSATVQKTVQEGHPFHIQADQRRSFPNALYGWEIAIDTVDKNPTHVRLSRRIQMAENGDLHFAYALPDDGLSGRIYKSTAYNPNLDVKSGGSYTRLTVTRGNLSQFPPTVAFVSESPAVAVIGRSITLRCFFSGYPEPTISWSGPRNRLPIGRYTTNPSNTELTINIITPADEGDYSCTGSNSEGSNTQTLQIRVEAVPRFLIPTNGPSDVNITEGESVTFNCKADAKPNAMIVWMKDGEELNLDHLLPRFALSNDKRSLTIIEVCRDCDDRETQTDLMVIQCNASNVHGYAFAQGYVNVLSRTVVTIHDATEVEVKVYEVGRVEFECRVTSDPSTPPIIRWYKLEAEGKRRLENVPPVLTISGGLLSIDVADNAVDTWPKFLGQYRCEATAGKSIVSQTANITSAKNVTPVYLPVKETICGEFLDLEICWIWVSIAAAVLGLVIILVIICYAIWHRRPKVENYSTTGRQALRVAVTEAADPFYDTIADHVDTYTELVPAVGYEDVQSYNTGTRANRVVATESGRLMTQRENTELERRYEQLSISPPELQSRAGYSTLQEIDLATSLMYTAL